MAPGLAAWDQESGPGGKAASAPCPPEGEGAGGTVDSACAVAGLWAVDSMYSGGLSSGALSAGFPLTTGRDAAVALGTPGPPGRLWPIMPWAGVAWEPHTPLGVFGAK